MTDFKGETPTQGEYAVKWAEKLGLGENLTEQQAIAGLTEAGIEPITGWQALEDITTEFLLEIFDLTLEAAHQGLVTFEPDKFSAQASYAVQLAEKLEIYQGGTAISVQDAISRLNRVGITPEAGWEPENKVDARFLADILKSTVEAADKKLISVSPEEAYGIVTSLSEELKIVEQLAPSERGVSDESVRGPAKPFEATELSEIEKLMSGQMPTVVSTELKQFGYDIFEKAMSTFAPVEDVPVGPGYIVGPGDSFTVLLWGRLNAHYTVTVNRSSEIALPEVGVLNVAGMTFGELRNYLERELSRKFTDFKMSITMDKLRTIQVFVVGEVQAPGAYTVSSLSTVINALFAASGPTKNGSLRNVRLMRSGRGPVTVDLYDFLLGGNKNSDIHLQNGDTIFVPLIGSVVGVAGNVKRPAIYEITEPVTLLGVLDLSGGVTYAGWLQRVQVERVAEHEKRIVVDFDMSGQDVGASRKLLETVIQDGDMVSVFPVLALEHNVVHLEGHVYRPGKYELKDSMRITDIISSYEVLQPQCNLEYAEVERLVPPDMHPVIIPFNIGGLLAGDDSEDIELQSRDTIRVFRWDERARKSVYVSGFVYLPGEYQFVDGMKVKELVETAGGIKKNTYLKDAEITRRYVSQDGIETEKIDIELGKALAGDAEHNIVTEWWRLTVR
ncbi:MAG: SLBB domain-containing protein [Planctomycetota bacterium]